MLQVNQLRIHQRILKSAKDSVKDSEDHAAGKSAKDSPKDSEIS